MLICVKIDKRSNIICKIYKYIDLSLNLNTVKHRTDYIYMMLNTVKHRTDYIYMKLNAVKHRTDYIYMYNKHGWHFVPCQGC